MSATVFTSHDVIVKYDFSSLEAAAKWLVKTIKTVKVTAFEVDGYYAVRDNGQWIWTFNSKKP